MPAELSAVLAFLAVVGVVALHFRLSALSRPLTEQLAKYRDALTAISGRADKEAAIAVQTLELLKAYEKAVGDKRSTEGALESERKQNTWLRDRVTELERAVMAFKDPVIEARVVRQGNPEKEEKVQAGPTRWAAASGTYRPSVSLEQMLRVKPIPDPVETA